MSPEPQPTPPCPSCGKPVEEAADLPPPGGREPARRRHGPAICRACGETLYRLGDRLLPHRIAALPLPMNVAAARLRNHLRRLAIVRIGRIEGDCYFLPFYRAEGAAPDGEESFALLASLLGEPRLESPCLPPADCRPFAAPAPGAAGASGSGHAALRVLHPTLSPEEAASRAERLARRVTRTVDLLHYPFWMMRVEDCGRIEGAWVDGIEARLIHHRLRLAAPIPGRRSRALMTALPAAASLSAAAAWPDLAAPAALAAWVAAAPLLYATFLRKWSG